MTTQLSKNIRTHIAVLKDGQELHLTQEQYSTVRMAKEDRKATEFITIKCPDTGKVEYDGELGQFKQFREKNIGGGDYTVICQLGERHESINGEINCNCLQKMGIFSGDIINSLNMLGFKINYPNEITKDMRILLYKEVRKEGFKENLNNYIENRKKEWIKYKRLNDPEYGINIF